jgi:hypothetical protein
MGIRVTAQRHLGNNCGMAGETLLVSVCENTSELISARYFLQRRDFYVPNLAASSCGGHSVGIVHLGTKATEF